jgi:hypothetical protein
MSLSYAGPTEIIAGGNIQGAWTATGENGPPFTFTADEALPQGLSLSPEGIFSGSTNSAPMEWKGNVTATDRTGKKSAPVAWEFKAVWPPITLNWTGPYWFEAGQPVQGRWKATGGRGGPYTFAISEGFSVGAPDLSLSPDGVLSGTPRDGSFGAEGFVTATDSAGQKSDPVRWSILVQRRSWRRRHTT